MGRVETWKPTEHSETGGRVNLKPGKVSGAFREEYAGSPDTWQPTFWGPLQKANRIIGDHIYNHLNGGWKGESYYKLMYFYLSRLSIPLCALSRLGKHQMYFCDEKTLHQLT